MLLCVYPSVHPSVIFTIMNTPTDYKCMWMVKVKAAHDIPGQAQRRRYSFNLFATRR